jgi:hypothetical protein
MRTTKTPKRVDAAAARIGKLYAESNASLVDGVLKRLECGRLLTAKKKSLQHGEWLPWLKANVKTLGFATDRTARMLMAAAREWDSEAINRKPASDLTEEDVAWVVEKMWGHEARRAEMDAEVERDPETQRIYREAKEAAAARIMKEETARFTRTGNKENAAKNYLAALKAFREAIDVACRHPYFFSHDALQLLVHTKHPAVSEAMQKLEAAIRSHLAKPKREAG